MIKRVAVIGAGTIGASWAAIFLARGLEVAAYDPAPNGESFLRKFIGNAWPTLRQLNWVLPEADPMRLTFHREIAGAVRDAEFVQESGPEREERSRLLQVVSAFRGSAQRQPRRLERFIRLCEEPLRRGEADQSFERRHPQVERLENGQRF